MESQPQTPTTNIIINTQRGPGFIVRAIYFLFVGWWLSGLWISLAWLLNLTILGLPLGLTMLNRIPQMMTLSPGSQAMRIQQIGNTTVISQGAEQLPMWLRAVYFVLVGWWASLAWLTAAYLVSLTVIGLPLAFIMFNLVGLVTTLRKN